MIETLISSKTRIKLLLKFFLNSNNSSYLRHLESEFGESTNAIRLELNKFENAGLLDSQVQGNKKYFQANRTHPLFNDIHNILLKFTGLDKIVDRVVGKLGALDRVYLIGRLAKGLNSDVVDLVFVGKIDKKYLFSLVEKTERAVDKKIKYILLDSTDDLSVEMDEQLNNGLLLWSK